jgi:hypothetical protein
MDAPNEITQQLIAWSKGDAAALERLIPAVYQELRSMASAEHWRSSVTNGIEARRSYKRIFQPFPSG